MANTIAITSRAAGVVNSVSGTIVSTGTAAAATISLGFVPRWVKVVDSTGVIVWEKIEGMAAADSVKTITAGTTTIDTGSAILINADGSITLSSTLCGNNKSIAWVAIA